MQKFVFIWTDTRPVGDNYHDGGGVLIVAQSLEWARDLWAAERSEYLQAVAENPDHVWPIYGEIEDRVLVFPDSGCC